MAKRINTQSQRRSQLQYAHITGWGMALPEQVLTNDDMAAIVDTNDEWIHSRTGIRQRYIANDKETTASLGLMAAKKALAQANTLPNEVQLIIVATSTPENIFPSTASLIQGWLGANRAGAFDLSAACSGFVYGIDMATQAIRSGSINTAIVIGSETMSRILDWQDRSTCILFGDGAGAVVLQGSSEYGGVLSSVLRSDGSGYDLLGVPSVGSVDIAYNNDHKPYKMHMNGREVFRFATRIMGESIEQALDKAELTIEDVTVVVPHQANNRILESAARNLKLDESKFISTVEQFGNTSAASIPMALCVALEQGRIQDDDNIVFIGFGGGLTWAAMVIQWGAKLDQESRSGPIFIRFRRRIAYLLARWHARLKRILRRFSNWLAVLGFRVGNDKEIRLKTDRHDR